MIRKTFSLTFLLLVFGGSSAHALPGDSLQSVRNQLRRSTFFETSTLRSPYDTYDGCEGLGNPFSTDRIDRSGGDIKFSTSFSNCRSEGESVLFYGDLAGSEIDRQNEASQLFMTDIWGSSVQNDFQNSRFIFDKSASCQEGQANMKIYQGDLYYYRTITKYFATEASTSFQVNSLDFLPIFLRDLGESLNRDNNTLCVFGPS